MRRGRGPAVAIALLLAAALAAAGCGFGPGSGVGEVSLTVTRDYGSEQMQRVASDEASESDTVMRVLDREAEISTRYSGGFVQTIDGLEADERFGHSFDWFFYVNGVESPVGAADFALHGGEAIWWDYRNWSAAQGVPAVVGSWPQPLLAGYEGKSHPVALECRGAGAACGAVRRRLDAAGIAPAAGPTDDAIRVLVGPWARLRDDPAAAQLEQGPQVSGVFADFTPRAGDYQLQGLDESGAPARNFGPSAGLVAATRRFDAPPVWLVSGATTSGALAAAGLLDTIRLRDHYAVATEGGQETPLPLR
ncbi:MAG TPA: DUF4430 domain-containing protein [Solirubrobacterales bacterium]|nr:DUF4430 domain-containing protein [Solirubrobacterales bacterium]